MHTGHLSNLGFKTIGGFVNIDKEDISSSISAMSPNFAMILLTDKVDFFWLGFFGGEFDTFVDGWFDI